MTKCTIIIYAPLCMEVHQCYLYTCSCIFFLLLCLSSGQGVDDNGLATSSWTHNHSGVPRQHCLVQLDNLISLKEIQHKNIITRMCWKLCNILLVDNLITRTYLADVSMRCSNPAPQGEMKLDWRDFELIGFLRDQST